MAGDSTDRTVIGLLINQYDGRYQALIRRGLGDFARERGLDLEIYVGRSLGSPYGNEDSYNGIYALARGGGGRPRPAGLVVCAGSIGSFVSTERSAAFLAEFAAVPLVTIGLALPEYPSVAADSYGGMAALAEHLATRHRFRRFAFAKGPAQSPDALERHRAWRDTLLRLGVAAADLVEYEGDFSYGSGQSLAARFSPNETLPFEVLSCANDDMAIGFLAGMAAKGFACPRDFALTGFDDIPDSGFLSPGLTTVRQALYDEAYAAGRLLLDAMAGAPAAAERAACAPVFRESCACAEPVVAIDRFRAADPAAGPGVPADPKAAALEAFAREGGFPPPLRAAGRDAVAALCDAAALDLRRYTDAPLFLQVLSGWLDGTDDWDDFSELWQRVLGAVGKSLLANLADPRSRSFAEDLSANGFALLARKSGERHARAANSLRNAMALFHELSVRLGPAADRSDLVRELARAAPGFGLRRIGLALHRGGPKPSGFASGDDHYGDVEAVACLDGPAGRETVHLPLLGRSLSFGYVALSGGGVGNVVYESLANLIARTLEAIDLQAVRARAEAALRESEERFREIAAALPVLVVETDCSFAIAFANDSAREGLGLEPNPAGSSLKPAMSAPDRRRAEKLLARLADAAVVDGPEVRFMNLRERRYVPVVRVNAKRDAAGRLVGIRWYALDLLPFLRDEILPGPDFFRSRHISPKAQKIVELQLQGRRIQQIADELGVAVSTVKGHLTQVYNRLGVSGKDELLQALKDERSVNLGYNAYVFSLLNQLLKIDDE